MRLQSRYYYCLEKDPSDILSPPLIDRLGVKGSREFYKQVGFEEVAKPITLANGRVEGVSRSRCTDTTKGNVHLSFIPFIGPNDAHEGHWRWFVGWKPIVGC